jgi:hypothetical protein
MPPKCNAAKIRLLSLPLRLRVGAGRIRTALQVKNLNHNLPYRLPLESFFDGDGVGVRCCAAVLRF